MNEIKVFKDFGKKFKIPFPEEKYKGFKKIPLRQKFGREEGGSESVSPDTNNEEEK